MGQATFNLTELWNRMGIKNPRPTMLESVQPVINVGDFHQLTPLHVAPTNIVGGDVFNAAGEFSIVQMQARGAGGTLINWWSWQNNAVRYMRIAAAIGGLTDRTANAVGPFSNDPTVSTFQSGTDPVNPVTTFGQRPQALAQNQSQQGTNLPLYLPNGATMVWSLNIVNTALNGWAICWTDLPASENPR